MSESSGEQLADMLQSAKHPWYLSQGYGVFTRNSSNFQKLSEK